MHSIYYLVLGILLVTNFVQCPCRQPTDMFNILFMAFANLTFKLTYQTFIDQTAINTCTMQAFNVQQLQQMKQNTCKFGIHRSI